MKKLCAILLFLSPPAQATDLSFAIKIIECESSGRHDVWGDDKSSFGLLQFQKQTFDEMRKRAKMPWLHWKNPVHQLMLFDWMLSHGYGNRWTCYRKIKKWEKK